MIWIIGENTETVMSAAVTADRDRLAANPAMQGQAARVLYQCRRADVVAPLPAPPLGAGEPLFVIAHAGGVPYPWIAGLPLQEFADAMFSKFGAAGLSNRVIWMLVCHVGRNIQGLASRLAHHGVVNATIYVPTDFMYISSAGIPHILLHADDPAAANRLVASYDSDFVSVPNSQDTGLGWAGRTISGIGAVTAIDDEDTEDAVIARFDPDRREIFG